jgi:hypothetical protein
MGAHPPLHAIFGEQTLSNFAATMATQKVTLHVYDLSGGMARQLSQQLTGRLFEGLQSSVRVNCERTFLTPSIWSTARRLAYWYLCVWA